MLHYDDDCDGELYPPSPCCHNQQPHLIWIPSVKYGKPITPTTNHQQPPHKMFTGGSSGLSPLFSLQSSATGEKARNIYSF